MGMKRVNVRSFGVYSATNDEGLRIDLPDGAVLSSLSASYQFVAY